MLLKETPLYSSLCNNFIDTYQTYKSISQSWSPQAKEESKKCFQTLDKQDQNRYCGHLKFFDEGKNYGFLGKVIIKVKEDDMSDVFVHFDDLQKANMSKEELKITKNSLLRFSFVILEYFGKHQKSRKAVDIIYLEAIPKN